ncbi:hypothetical protein [Pseudomonas tohonis]|uniref:hypothetical protein n=1 Tax=Pseudomonas tohonis TaxID=2725477 RepID=UPI001F287ED9|nr:hypothetical protein [Pseudomonas tohonis]GJN44903.1 hypothetical protein TUM20249_08890 [Pseudomonas tohonis]
MVYKSVLAAVVSAMASEALDNTSKQSWQKLIDHINQPGGRGASVSPELRMQIDCWVHARLHSELPSRLWFALVAKYCTHHARRLEAIGRLDALIVTPAPGLFRKKAVVAWAVPPMKGKPVGADGLKRSTQILALPASFYDMNTWDLDASPERTKRRWRAGIFKALDELVNVALMEAGEILDREGLVPSFNGAAVA